MLATALWFVLLLIVLFLFSYGILLLVMYHRLKPFLFATRPSYPSCPQPYRYRGCRWRWLELKPGVVVWDTVKASNPTLPVIVIASGLWVNASEQRQFMKFLVRHGYRVIIVFYRLFEGASTQSRVRDFHWAWQMYIHAQIQQSSRPATLLGISYGCTVLTRWLDWLHCKHHMEAEDISRLVLLHPVVSFWSACSYVMPGMIWFRERQSLASSLWTPLARVKCRYATTVVCAHDDVFTDVDAWMRWCKRDAHIPAIRLCNRNGDTPYNQHFYARYHDWCDWGHVLQ